ncbi:glycosyl hydrolase [Leptodontidium sp. MPI-SDFR-AT-0119]|nr:glycosyl hydrolase [Leptodontidium sp. MPI-SDFR-AT-0119]
MFSLSVLWLLCLCFVDQSYSSSIRSMNKTYNNPILPGWNSDPSCTFVKEWDNTFFCTTSSFLAFPGVPIYASKDLANWKLASNALNRPEQLPELSTNGQQNEGIWASTIRFHKGTFYLITSYVSLTKWQPKLLLFTTTNPYDDTAWSDPVHVENPANDIDPDIFWDDDGKTYMALASGIYISEIDVVTGATTEPFKVWNGTGDRNPEGPHLYKKDGYYYLLIGEGGTETNHSVTIARSKDFRGPYEGYANNPILTAKNTENYFQTVGHADLFQDASDNWWAVALATRSGPAWEIYPMGRETVLVPAKWEEGQWPVLDPARGRMSGPLSRTNKHIPGDAPFVDDPDIVDFPPGSTIPKYFAFWRPPKTSLFAVSPPGHANALRISPSRVNLTADNAFQPSVDGLGFVARKQTATLFDYSVDVSFNPTVLNEEAGVSVFLTQLQHIDLGIVNLPDRSGSSLAPMLRFRIEASGKPNTIVPETKVVPIPSSWLGGPIRLMVSATSDSEYRLSAAPASKPKDVKVVGTASAAIVSGGSGPFSGEFDLGFWMDLRLCVFVNGLLMMAYRHFSWGVRYK